jgi:signal transduction histidine kinase/DNA-binding response OmpR family regulator
VLSTGIGSRYRKICSIPLFFIILLISAQSYCQNTTDSLRQLIKSADGLRTAELHLEMATYFLDQNPDSAIFYSQKAAKTGKEINSHVIIIRSFAKIGEAYQKQSMIKEAITYYLKGLELAERHDEKSLAGTIYNGIGVCYFYQNDLKKAEKYLKLAAQAKKEAKDYQYYAFISVNLASLQIANQSYTKAIKTLKEAEKILVKNRQQQYLATVYNSIGAAYQAVKPDSCLYYYQKGLDQAVKYKDIVNQMTTYQNIGDYYLEKKNYGLAINFMLKAIEVNDQRPEDQYKPALYGRISLAYESVGDFKNAYKYKNIENETRKRLSLIQKQKDAEELEVKYQTEKKEKEIQLNKQEIEKGKTQRNQIIFAALLIVIITGFVFYLIFQRKKITQQFEQEKLKLFENIFHEIKTPLTLIEGPVQLMKQQPDTKNEEQLLLIERNAKKLTRLVNELLDASKLGKGNYQLDYTTGNPADFIDDIVKGFSAEAQSEGIPIINQSFSEGHYSFPSNVLDKILSNLIGNAIKYCPKGSEIHIKSKIEGNTLVIEVGDNGLGIPKNEQKKVFHRFFRGRQSSGTNGTGIGLSLVKELVNLANGAIHLQSSPSGTLFTITMPIQEAQLHSPAMQKESMPLLLLAEDDADTAAFTISVLRDNFNIIHVKNGQEAIGRIREELPDIVLSDIMMPEKDGIQLLKEIRYDELLNHIPVILFSAKASLKSRLEGLEQGADAYIAKPFSPDELKFTLNNIFTTISRNKDRYQAAIKSSKTFEERIKSDNSYVNKIIGHIVTNIGSHEYSVNELASDMAVSRSHLHRKLVSLTGFSASNFIRMIRLEKAKDFLQAGDGNISEIAFKCGFSSQSYFTKSFTEHFGESPSQFIKNQHV